MRSRKKSHDSSGNIAQSPSALGTNIAAELSEEDGDDDGKEKEEEEDGIFTHGDRLAFQLTFGAGPIGIVVADTRAGKGELISVGL